MLKALKYLGYTIALLLVIILTQLRCNIPVSELTPKYTNTESKFIEVDGMQVHYRVEGNGPPLVLLHGTAASLHTWEGWANELKGEFKIISFDLPAFGLTGPNPANDYSIKYYVDFVHRFMDKIGIYEFHLAGNSLGGQMAWNYALTYPKQVKKLVLIDAAGYSLDRQIPFVFKLARIPVVKDVFAYITPKFMIRKSIEDVYGNDDLITDELVDRYYNFTLRDGNREAFVARANTTFQYQTERIPEINTPTLILWGEDDKWIPLEHGKLFDKEIPKSELIVYPGVGHVPMEEIPAKTAEDTRAFLLRATL
jgi:pimeloyl-ACP methyl ester carboxylesterase